MNSFFPLASATLPTATRTTAASPDFHPHNKPEPESVRVFRAPALPSFLPCWQEVPFTAHLGPRIREPV